MVTYNTDILSLDIVKYGIYSLGLSSATGKTYLIGLLRKMYGILKDVGIHIVLIDDQSLYDNFNMLVKDIPADTLIVLDRWDLYGTHEQMLLLKEVCNNCTALLDTKWSQYKYMIDGRAKMSMSKDGVSVKI